MTLSSSRISGIWLMIKASIGFSAMALCVKFVSRTMPSLEIIFFRSLIGTLMIGTLILSRGVSFLGKDRKMMTLRGLSGFIALSLHFYTIAHLPLGLAVMLNYTGPIFAAIFAYFFLDENFGPLHWALILLSFVGVYLLAGASLKGPAIMVFLGLLSAVFVGIVYVSIRAIKGRESPLTIIFYFTAVSTIGSLAFLPFGFQWPNLREWLLILGVSVGSFYGQLWMTLSLRRAPASIVSPFSYLTPVLSFLYGLIFFGDKISIVPLIGAGLIILGGSLMICLEKHAPIG